MERPRDSGWLKVAGYLVVGYAIVIVAYRGLPVALPGRPFSGWALGIVGAMILYGLHRRLTRKCDVETQEGWPPLRRGTKHFLVGFVFGAMLVSSIAVLIWALLPFSWEFNSRVAASAVAATLIHHLITNTCEELAWRGYVLFRLRNMLGVFAAVIVIALVSATFHVLSGWSWRIVLTHTTAGSLLFSAIVLRWNSLPAAIGVHVAWNMTRDAVLSFPAVPASILVPTATRELTAADWAVAEILLVGVTLVATALVAWVRPSSRKT
jgi:membrane protease YdiL (CAAX protease family)